MGVTIADVARLAGVGRGTVSRVLNDRANVDPQTRARVMAAIQELDFVPSHTARRLSLGRTQTVAVILPFLTRPSAVERLRGIEFALVQAGYDLIVFNVETVQRRDSVFQDLPRAERVDGLIIVSLSPHEIELERIRRSGLPTVLVDAHHRSLPRVVADDVGGGRIATEHLIALGHRRIGFIGDIPRVPLAFTSSRLRLAGVRRATTDRRSVAARLDDRDRRPLASSGSGAGAQDAPASPAVRPGSSAPAIPRRRARSRPRRRSACRSRVMSRSPATTTSSSPTTSGSRPSASPCSSPASGRCSACSRGSTGDRWGRCARSRTSASWCAGRRRRSPPERRPRHAPRLTSVRPLTDTALEPVPTKGPQRRGCDPVFRSVVPCSAPPCGGSPHDGRRHPELTTDIPGSISPRAAARRTSSAGPPPTPPSLDRATDRAAARLRALGDPEPDPFLERLERWWEDLVVGWTSVYGMGGPGQGSGSTGSSMSSSTATTTAALPSAGSTTSGPRTPTGSRTHR